MGKREEIYNAKEKVYKLLKEEPETRDSDRLLFVRLAERQYGRPLPELRMVLLNKNNGVPATETARRARQKLQEEHPELRSTEEVQETKEEFEKSFRAVMGRH